MKNATWFTRFSKFNFIFPILKRHRWLLVVGLGSEVVVALLNAFLPYFSKLQIDQLQKSSSTLAGWQFGSPVTVFMLLLIGPVCLELARLALFDRISRALSAQLYTELRLATELFIWQKLQQLDAGFFTNRRNQRILSAALGSTSVTNSVLQFIKTRLNNGTTLLAILPLLSLISWQLLLVVVIASLIQMFLSEVTRKHEVALSTLRDRQLEQYWRVDQALTYDFHNLRILGASDVLLAEYQTAMRQRNELDITHDNMRERFRMYSWLVQNAMTFCAHMLVGWQVFQGNLTVGTFTLVISYSLQLNGLFRSLLDTNKEWQQIDLDLDRFQFFTLLRSRIKTVAQPASVPPPRTWQLQQVEFRYPDLFSEEREYLQLIQQKTTGYLSKFSSHWYEHDLKQWQDILADTGEKPLVLSHVNLELKPGKLVALLGRNGAGKTTITQLLLHSYEPTSGSILLNGRPLYEYDQTQLLQQFSIVHQEPFILYRFSIRENLLLGVQRTITDQEVWQLLDELDLAKDIKKIPAGLEAVIGEGIKLSGGQQQLLAVARVLLQQRPFIIFDEGTSQLDAEHESKVLQLLTQQKARAAILFITHRMTTARRADEIYVLDQGKIAEHGTHPKLLKQQGIYAKFWQLQVVD